jgi:hypothetical protein
MPTKINASLPATQYPHHEEHGEKTTKDITL